MSVLRYRVQGRVEFVRYQNGALWYRCSNDGFEFLVPMAETGDATFPRDDKALLYMRWIRAHMTMLDEARDAASADVQRKSEGT